MNAVERLWRALQARDWERTRMQFHAQATVELPHTGERVGVEEYVTVHRLHPGEHSVAVRSISAASDDRPIAVHAVLTGQDETWHCAGFYVLQQARIAHATELWLRQGTDTVPAWRR